VYQVLVPTLAAKRQEKADQYAQERIMQMKALAVVKHMRSFAGLTPIAVDKSEAQKQEDAKSNAKAFASNWKKRATTPSTEHIDTSHQTEPKEKTPLLFGKGNINATSADEIRTVEAVAKEVEEEGKEEKSFNRLLGESIFFMLFGAALVAFFSDPMVDALTHIGTRLNINPFYISFLITPFCSNASELVAALVFAAKKKTKNPHP